MYGSAPGWYQDSFYDITPPWAGQYEESHAPFGNSRLLPTYTSRPRLLPLGPMSDVTSTAGPPSTVGPSASENGATTSVKKVEFSITHYICCVTMRPPRSSSTAECLHLIACPKRGTGIYCLLGTSATI